MECHISLFGRRRLPRISTSEARRTTSILRLALFLFVLIYCISETKNWYWPDAVKVSLLSKTIEKDRRCPHASSEVGVGVGPDTWMVTSFVSTPPFTTAILEEVGNPHAYLPLLPNSAFL